MNYDLGKKMLGALIKLNNARIKRKIARQELPWKTLKNIDRPSCTTSLIPKIVYQTWENKLVGRNHFKSIQDFININEDLSFYYFDKDERANYIRQHWGDHQIHEIYERAKFGQLQADIFRYCILAERGGYYFDISKGCKTPLSKIHSPTDTALITYEETFCGILPESGNLSNFIEPYRYIQQWGFGFKPEHPFLLQTIDNICKYYPFFKGKTFPNPKQAILSFTGPGMFTKSIRDVIKKGFSEPWCQAGINFNSQGVFIMPGSHARYLTHPDYANKIDSLIID